MIYRQRRRHEAAALRQALAERVGALTGCAFTIETIWVDLDERAAQAVVDGVRFRWEKSQLVLLRPCALCGTALPARMSNTGVCIPSGILGIGVEQE